MKLCNLYRPMLRNEPPSYRGIELALVAVPVLLAFIGAVVTIEMRYAKASDVQLLVKEYYDKTVQLRLLELELKGSDLKPHERALAEHLKRELKSQ